MRRLPAVLGVIVLALLVPAATAGPVGGLSQTAVDADTVVMNADIAADGDAVWTVDYRVRLADDEEARAFEDLQADVRANESTYTDRFRDRMNRTARAGENATGREMTIDNVTVATSQENFGQSYGVVSYRFRWTNFAAVNDTHIRAGDALSGLYLDRNTSLTLQWPAEYRTAGVRPDPDDSDGASVTWRGPESFGADEPRVVLSSVERPFRDADGGLSTLPTVLALVVGALAIAGGGYGVYRYVRADPATAGADQEPDGDSEDTPPPELLSNEEQVLQLLRDEGGRIKQQRVAGELDWTAAKTSQVIGGLREDDEVETFRIGRENVVTLPDTDLADDGADGD